MHGCGLGIWGSTPMMPQAWILNQRGKLPTATPPIGSASGPALVDGKALLFQVAAPFQVLIPLPTSPRVSRNTIARAKAMLPLSTASGSAEA